MLGQSWRLFAEVARVYSPGGVEAALEEQTEEEEM